MSSLFALLSQRLTAVTSAKELYLGPTAFKISRSNLSWIVHACTTDSLRHLGVLLVLTGHLIQPFKIIRSYNCTAQM